VRILARFPARETAKRVNRLDSVALVSTLTAAYSLAGLDARGWGEEQRV